MAKDTRQRIIEKATVLFYKKGYQNVGIREIAKETGCSHTTLYLYFKTKEEILFEVAQQPLQQLLVKMQTIINTSKRLQEKILEISHLYIEFGFEHRNSYDLLFLYDGERVDAESFKRPINELRVSIFNFLKQMIDEIFFDIKDAEVRLNLTRGTFLFLHGFVQLYSIENNEYDERLKKIVTDYLGSTILK